MAEWAEDPRCVVNYNVLNARISRMRWPVDKALTQPSAPNRGKKPTGQLFNHLTVILADASGPLSVREVIERLKLTTWPLVAKDPVNGQQ